MGLNLETLIGILVILILLILADGVRRMIRERHGRLRMRIDPRYRDQAEEEESSGYNPELIGSARVIRRAMEDAEQDERPPMVMEPDEAAAEARTAETASSSEAWARTTQAGGLSACDGTTTQPPLPSRASTPAGAPTTMAASVTTAASQPCGRPRTVTSHGS